MYFNLNAREVIKLQLINNFWMLVAAYKSWFLKYKALIPKFQLVLLTSLYLSVKYLELPKTCDNVRNQIIMANFLARVCWFLAIVIETSGSDLQKKIKVKGVNDVKEQCARALSVDPEMNMDCCITGGCVKRTGFQLDTLLDDPITKPVTKDWFYCDGKDIT